MGNPEHISWLLEGVESWNKRRNDYLPGGFRFKPDFMGEDLYLAHLKAIKIGSQGRIPLSGVDFSETTLVEANLASSDLSNANLQFANLSGATLSHSNLTNAVMHHAVLIPFERNEA